MTNIKKSLDDLFYLILKVPKSKNKNNLNYKNVKKWDSLNHINLILSIESKFKVKSTAEQNFKLNSYKKILSLLKKQMNEINITPYHEVFEKLKKFNKFDKKIQIYTLYNFNPLVLENYIRFSLSKKKIDTKFIKSDYNQIDKEIF